MEIKLSDLWSLFKKCFIWILVVAILCGAAMGIGTKLLGQEIYSSTIPMSVAVRSWESAGSIDVEDANAQMIVMSRIVADIDIPLKTRTTMEDLLRYLEDRRALEPENEMLLLEYTYTSAQLSRMFAFSIPDTTTYKTNFYVTVNAYSAHDAAVLLSAFCDICNAHIPQNYAAVCTITPLEKPLLGVKTAPSVSRNAVIGALLGAVITFVIAFAVRLLNQRMYTEEDLTEAFPGVPVIGQIPVIKTRRAKEKSSGARKENANA